MIIKMEPYFNILESNGRLNKLGSKVVKLISKYSKKKLSKMSVLDIGCGNGFFEFALAPYFETIYGIDPSEKMLHNARKTNNIFEYKNIRFYSGSAENNPFVRKFDLILFSYSLHYTNDPLMSLERISKNIKDGGLLLILEPTKTFLPGGKYDKTESHFGKEIYKKKLERLQETRKIVNKFIKTHNLLDKIYDNRIYSILIRY